MNINLDTAGHKKVELDQLLVQKDEIIGTKGQITSIPLDEGKCHKGANGE